ncbi:hypothetical protein [Zymobacter sp. IVIA_5232.4 C2]|uniref:hypothetical protein n=1 Tax=Zymobacter sp. IVIA_5232.4 C2 TaxID=3394855 RepID=UPI0039C0EC7E
MFKRTLAACAILLSSHAIAESAPDCSPDKDARIYLGLITSTDEANLKEEMNDIANNSDQLNIKQLSSTRMSLKEQKALMNRRAKKNNYTASDIDEGGLSAQYLGTHIFKQYYDIKTPSGLHMIAEIYSIPHNCAVDIGSIYFISKAIDGNTPSFADRAYTPY